MNYNATYAVLSTLHSALEMNYATLSARVNSHPATVYCSLTDALLCNTVNQLIYQKLVSVTSIERPLDTRAAYLSVNDLAACASLRFMLTPLGISVFMEGFSTTHQVVNSKALKSPPTFILPFGYGVIAGVCLIVLLNMLDYVL